LTDPLFSQPFQLAFFLLIAALALQSTDASISVRLPRNVEGGQHSAINTLESDTMAKDPSDLKNVHAAGAYFRPLFTFRMQQEKERKYWEQRRIDEQGRK
jgi:hypothetical protein